MAGTSLVRRRALPTVMMVALAADSPAGLIVGPGCQTVPACIARVREVADPDEGIDTSKGEVAERLQSLSPQSIPAVIELLKDADPNVRELAGFILRDMPGLRPEHLGPLERAVEAGDGWLPPAIASIGTPEAIRFLVGELKKKPETETQLTYAFERLGPAALPELLELFRCGTSCDERLLRVVQSILSETRNGAAEAVDPLLTIATEEGGTLVARRAALRALGALGATARPAAKTLVEMTHQRPVELQAEARRAVLAIGGSGTREALETSLDGTEDQRLVLRDLAALGDAGREAGPRVEKLLSSSEPEVRVAAARTLGFIGYRAASPSLVAALDDSDDWRVVYVAAEALGRLRAIEAREALQTTASTHWYPPVREAARTALRALDAKYRYVSSPYRTNFALDFFDYEWAGREYSPCADQAHYPALPQRPETLDPTGQPSLAEQLAYDREIRGLSKKGWETTRRRTIPEVGLRIEGGWLVGVDHGEWGGELVLKADGGGTTKILDRNIAGLHLLADGRIVAVTGLAHLAMNGGRLYTVACAPAKGCSASQWKALPGAPSSSWLIATGELLVNTNGGSVLVAPDGTLRLADCHSATRPKQRPGAPRSSPKAR